MSPSLGKMFSAAVKQLVLREGRGGQNNLAERLGVKKAHVSNMLAGRGNWPDHLKEKVAQTYGYSVAELLLMGEQFLQTGLWFPHVRRVMHLPPQSMERLEAIIRMAAEDVGFGLPHVLFSSHTIPHIFHSLHSDYLAGKISDAAAYDHALHFMHKICPTKRAVN